QKGGGRAGEAEQGRVRDAVELRADGVVDLGAAVSVQVHPERGDTVEIGTALLVDKMVALGACDDEGLVVEPGAHLGEGMPHVASVELDNRCHDKDSPKAAMAASMCSSVWAAERAKRRRPVPGGTVGGRMPCAKIPRSSRARLTVIVRAESPTW